MSPTLAFLLCTAFVLFLLWVERQASGGVSTLLWIPTLWMMMIASRPLGSWFGIQGDNDSGSALDQWVLACLTVAAIVVLARRRSNWTGILLRQKWLVALLLYMLASTLWSDITLIALRRWARAVIIFPMALLVLSETDPRQALASVMRRSAFVLIPFSLILIKYYPVLGRAYGRWSGVEMWTGVTGQKNQLGRLCMIIAFFLFWELYQRKRAHPRAGVERYQRWADVAVVVIALYLLKGSDSYTSMATLVVGVAGCLGLRLLGNLKLVVPQAGLLSLVIFLMAFGTATPLVGGVNVSSFTTSIGRDSTLTGRTQIWAAVLLAREQQPLLGYGLGSFWTDARRQIYNIPTAHNGYLDILLELGEVGLLLYVAWLLSIVRKLHRALPRDYEWASLAICLLLMGLVYNISESALNGFTEQMTALMTLASLVASCGAKSRSESARDAVADVETHGGAPTRERWAELTQHGAWTEPMATGAEDQSDPAFLAG